MNYLQLLEVTPPPGAFDAIKTLLSQSFTIIGNGITFLMDNPLLAVGAIISIGSGVLYTAKGIFRN